MKRILTFAILLAAAATAQAADWVLFSTAVASGAPCYYDRETVRYFAPSGSDEYVVVWAKLLQSDGSKLVTREQITRDGHLERSLSAAHYAADGRLDDSSSKPTAWDEIIPESVMDNLYSALWRNRSSSSRKDPTTRM